MNCKLDGKELSTEELWEIADLSDVDRKAVHALHNTALIRSRLTDLTADKRFKMFTRGELRLATRVR